MTLNEIYDALRDYMDASLCVNGESDKAGKEALEALKAYCWKPVMCGDGEMPPVDEDGYSKKLLVSFANSDLICIGEYRHDADRGGSFYDGDTADTFSKFGLIVDAWMPIPESYKEADED